ncbi:protein kinase, partial [bacterium]|nr:protein kinase [candidate division CSSED10-310 bacterium]
MKNEYLGDCKLQKIIGQGGQAIVYQAVDSHGDIIAIKKLIALDHPERFIREFRTLQKLDHFNIIKVFSWGEFNRHPYFIMEYIDGLDVVSCMQNHFPKGPIQKGWLEELIDFVDQLCQSLSFIHQKGIIHRDLKPSNILVDKDNRLVLMDFGLVSLIDAMTITGGSTILGSLPYMSPEQLFGQTLDRRADLYALGVLLYYIASHRYPYDYKTPYDLMNRIVQQEKVPLEARGVTLPQWYFDLVSSLLEKDRDKRPTDSIAIINFIRKAYQQTKETSWIQSRDFPLLSIFVGRKKELLLFRNILSLKEDYPNTAALIYGEAGIGKSRLLEEVAAIGRTLDYRVLFVRCKGSMGLPYEPIQELFITISKYIDDSSLSLLEQLPHDDMVIISHIITVFKKFQNGNNTLLSQLSASTLKKRFSQAVINMFFRWSKEKPILLIFEDLHEIDTNSIELLLEWCRKLSASPQVNLTLVGSYRDIAIHPDSGLMELIETIRTLHNGILMKLNPLTESQINDFLTLALSEGIREKVFTDFLYRKSGGNPFYLNSILTEMRKKTKVDSIAQKDSSEITELFIPETVKSSVLSQKNDLSVIEQNILDIMATSAVPISNTFLMELQLASREEIYDALSTLVTQRIIKDYEKPTDTFYQFSHELMGDVIYRSLGSSRRIRLHRKIAAIMEETNKTGLRFAFEEIARHYQAGKQEKSAMINYVQAGKDALEKWAPQIAIQHLNNAKDILNSPGISNEDIQDHHRYELYKSLAKAYEQTGNISESDAVLHQAMKEAVHWKNPNYTSDILIMLGDNAIRK